MRSCFQSGPPCGYRARRGGVPAAKPCPGTGSPGIRAPAPSPELCPFTLTAQCWCFPGLGRRKESQHLQSGRCFTNCWVQADKMRFYMGTFLDPTFGDTTGRHQRLRVRVSLCMCVCICVQSGETADQRPYYPPRREVSHSLWHRLCPWRRNGLASGSAVSWTAWGSLNTRVASSGLIPSSAKPMTTVPAPQGCGEPLRAALHPTGPWASRC